MFNNTNPKRAVETFIVNKSGTNALINADAATENLIEAGAINADILPGKIGITVNEPGESGYYISAALTNYTDRPIRFIQGTEDSQNLGQAWLNRTYPLTPQAFIESTEIMPYDRVRITSQVYNPSRNTVWVIGDTGAVASGGITALGNTEFALTIAYRGRIIDEYFSPETTANFVASYTTPDYTALGTAFPLDHLVQNLAYVINRNSVISGAYPQSRENVVAIALDLTGLSGTLVSALTVGFLPLFNTTTGVRGITLDADLLATLQAALPTGSSIVTIDTTTAGAANSTQSLALLALDRRRVYEDAGVDTKIRIDVGLRYGFAQGVTHIERTSNAREAQGTFNQLNSWWKATHAQRMYSLSHEEIPVINYPTPFETGVNYNMLIVENTNSRQIDTHNVVMSPKKTIVCVPTGNTTGWTNITTVLAQWATPNGFGTAADWAA